MKRYKGSAKYEMQTNKEKIKSAGICLSPEQV
jgi:hypothetical protein